MKNLFYLALALFAFSFTSCDNDDNKTPDLKGVFISNEGSYKKSNGSISLFNTNTKEVTNNLFQTANNRVAGDVVQSFYVADSKGFIIANNSKKVEVVSMKDFKTIEVIKADYPRYMVDGPGNKAYLSNGSAAGVVHVINTDSYQITSSIAVGNGPENMLIYGSKLFVANSGGYSKDNKVSVINTETDKLIKDIAVKDNPTDLVIDANNKVWVLCKGHAVYDSNPPYAIISQTPSYLLCINPASYEIEKELKISETAHPSRLAIGDEGKYVYYENGGVFKMDVEASELPTQAIINGSAYGLEVNPNTGNIYRFSSPTFGAAGIMTRYTKTGEKVDEYTVGIGPNGAFFSGN